MEDSTFGELAGERLWIVAGLERSSGLKEILGSHNESHLQQHQVWEKLATVRKFYWVCCIKVDAKHLGDPASRRRVYVILVRKFLGSSCSIVEAQTSKQLQVIS